MSQNRPIVGYSLHFKYKIAFLNTVFLMASLAAFGMGFYRWQLSPLMGSIDFGFSAISISLLYYLKLHKEKIELISTIAIMLAYLLFLAIYLLAPYNTMRLSLFFLLAAATFYLKGRKTGLLWLFFILFTILSGHFLSGFNTGYSLIDIATTCLYLTALFVIFWNYETVREHQIEREREHELQSLVEERWRVALDGVGDAIWDWNLQTNNFIFSKRYAEMFGYTEEDIGHTPEHLERLLHPEDKTTVTAHFKKYLRGEIGEQYVSEYRIRCKDDSYKWILCRGRVTQRESTGRPQHMVGTYVDITERKLAEAQTALYLSLLQSTLESTDNAVLVVDLNNTWVLHNQRFLDLWQVTDEMIAAKDDSSALLIAQNQLEDPDTFLNKVRELYTTPEASSFDMLHFKNGKIIERYSVPQRIEEKVVGRVWSFRDVTERVHMQEQVSQLAFYDTLTNLPNRRLLNDRLGQAMAASSRSGCYGALMFLDLDNFKPLNDTHGHVAGDLLLVEVADRLKNCIREMDTVARFGGDEFVVILNELTTDKAESTTQTASVAEKIRTVLAKHYSLSLHYGESASITILHHCTVSIGVAVFQNHKISADDVLRSADTAMYQAKEAGRNQICFYNENN